MKEDDSTRKLRTWYTWPVLPAYAYILHKEKTQSQTEEQQLGPGLIFWRNTSCYSYEIAQLNPFSSRNGFKEKH